MSTLPSPLLPPWYSSGFQSPPEDSLFFAITTLAAKYNLKAAKCGGPILATMEKLTSVSPPEPYVHGMVSVTAPSGMLRICLAAEFFNTSTNNADLRIRLYAIAMGAYQPPEDQ
ncbi:MAG: hypothetical protein ABSE56_02525 [Bryobacteraceae bacterium]|jgi:hypothetical protein